MEQLSVEDWKPDACPKNITVEEYLAGEVLSGEYDVSETNQTEET